MIVRCASCGWSDSGCGSEEDASWRGANHLRSCARRDDLRLAPWWVTMHETDRAAPLDLAVMLDAVVLEVGWHPLSINEPYLTTVGYLASPPSTYTLPEPRWSQSPTRHRFTRLAEFNIIGYRGDPSDARDPLTPEQQRYLDHVFGVGWEQRL